MVLPTPQSSHERRSQEPVSPDRNPWLLLLIIPVVVPLMTFLYNRVEPTVLGIPAFYWVQLVFVPFSAAITAVVYFKTRGGDRRG